MDQRLWEDRWISTQWEDTERSHRHAFIQRVFVVLWFNFQIKRMSTSWDMSYSLLNWWNWSRIMKLIHDITRLRPIIKSLSQNSTTRAFWNQESTFNHLVTTTIEFGLLSHHIVDCWKNFQTSQQSFACYVPPAYKSKYLYFYKTFCNNFRG